MTGRWASWAWMGVGVVVGAALTVGLVLFVGDAVRGDAPTEAMGPPSYGEVVAGIDHTYDGDFEYFVGGGVAVLDCDDDHLPDLYFAGGTEPAGLYRNESTGGELGFSEVDSEAATVTGVTGAYPLDVDSDGATDLAVLRVGENLMLRGLGDCAFEVSNDAWGIDGGDDWTAAFSATWEDGHDRPTMVFGNYLDLDALEDGDRTCADHVLVRPDGDGYASETVTPGYCTLSALFSDWDRSGRRDLRMTNDRHYYTDGSEQLWRLGERGVEPYTAADGWQDMQIWGMGIASRDVTGDTRPEVYLTSQGDNKLQSLAEEAAGPTYTDIALQTGANAHRPFAGDITRPSTAWHPEFDDVNNDGWVDLFVTKGNVEAMDEFADQDPNNLLLGHPDGTFVEAAPEAGLLDMSRSRGAAVTDLDLDGRLDVVVVERREPVKVWHNTGPAGNWIALTLSQIGPNPAAIGSWIQVRIGSTTLEQELTVGGGHASGESGWLHFGLGDADDAEVRIIWPDGQESPWHPVAANTPYLLDRGTDPVEWPGG